MKRNFLTYALILTLMSLRPVNAENAKSVSLGNSNIDLQEIVLDKDQVYEAPNSVLMATDTSSSDVTLENKSITPQEKEKGFFSIFNLKGGVEKGAQTLEAEVEKTKVKQWLDGDYATGKWFGARPLLEDHGVSLQSSLLYSPMVKTGGGANGESSAKGYSLFNLSLTIDTEKAHMWKGGTFYGLYQSKMGYGLSGPNGGDGAMGDWMGLDGWDWREMNQISEYWYQQTLFDEKVRLKLGKQDANTDFGFLNSGWDFMNTAFSVNPTVPMPTYPDPAFGFMAEISPKEWLSIA